MIVCRKRYIAHRKSRDLASAAESPHTLCSFECCSCLRHSWDRCSWALRTTRSLAMAGQAFNHQDLVTLRQTSLHDFPSDYRRRKKLVLLCGGDWLLEKTVWSQSSSVSKQDKIAQVDFKTRPTVYLRKVRKCKVAKIVLLPCCLHFPCPVGKDLHAYLNFDIDFKWRNLIKIRPRWQRTWVFSPLTARWDSDWPHEGWTRATGHRLSLSTWHLELSKTIQDCWEVRKSQKSNSTWPTSRKQGLKWRHLRHRRATILSCQLMPFDLTVCITGLYSQDSGEKPPATLPRSGRSKSPQLSWFVTRSVRKSWGYWCFSLVSHLEVHPQCTREWRFISAEAGTSGTRWYKQVKVLKLLYLHRKRYRYTFLSQIRNKRIFSYDRRSSLHICNAGLASAESPWAAGIKCLECWH